MVVCDVLGADNVVMGGGTCCIFDYRELPLNVKG